MAKTAKWAGGLILSALVLTATAPVHAAPPAAGKPQTAAKSSPGTKPDPAKADLKPQPRPEPQVVRHTGPASPKKEATAKKALARQAPSRVARPSAPHRIQAQNTRIRAPESREEWRAFDEWRATSRREYRPPSGPVTKYMPGPMKSDSGPGCDDVCRYHAQYREWLERYRAWYDRYGRYDPARDRMADQAPPSYQPGFLPPRHFYPAGDIRADQNARDRQDPWHGYNDHDGPENGY